MSILSNTTIGDEPIVEAAMAGRAKKSHPAGERKVAPVHPGQVIGGILEEQGVSLRAAARAIGVTPMALGNVINGKSAVSADMALRIGVYLWNGPDLWLRMQADYDLWHARARLKAELARIEPLKERESDAA